MRRRTEVLLVGAFAVAAPLVTNPAQVAGLADTAPSDLGDPLYFAWQLAWVGHALTTDPGHLWTTNEFQGAKDNLAYTDTVLGWAPLTLVTPGGQSGALAQLNLATLIAGMLAIAGGYLLARVLGSTIAGALVAGVGYGFAPWRITQVIHINIISNAGIPITLALLAYGHGWSLRHGWRPDRIRAGWAAAGWLAACWQLTFGFALGIWFVYTVAVVTLALGVGWLLAGRRRMPWKRLPRRLLLADGLGGLVFLGWTYLLVTPYLRVLASHPDAQRSVAMLDLFSPPWFGLLTGAQYDWFWGDKQQLWRATRGWWAPEMEMSPGLLLLGVAVAGLFISRWPLRRRIGVAAVTAVLTVLSLGTTFPLAQYTYVPLYFHLPGWGNLRTPGRLMIWVTLGLCLLAAGAVDRIWHSVVEYQAQHVRSADSRAMRRRVAAALLTLPSLAILVEGLNVTPHWQVARSPIRLAALPQPLLILPSDIVVDYHLMLWSTEGWPVIANGDSGFNATEQARLRDSVLGFPDQASLDALHQRGIATVVLIRSRVGGTPDAKWFGAAGKPVTGLDLTRTDEGDAVVFDVRKH